MYSLNRHTHLRKKLLFSTQKLNREHMEKKGDIGLVAYSMVFINLSPFPPFVLFIKVKKHKSILIAMYFFLA